MSINVKQIAKEFRVTNNDIISFLIAQGCPTTIGHKFEVSDELYDKLVKNQNRLSNPSNVIVKKTDEIDISKLPFEIRIATILKKEKKISERILGYTPFNWNYNIITFEGVCAKPLPFDEFDEVISEILKIDEGLSLSGIGDILGMDTDKNIAEKNILTKAIESLKTFKMIEGDDSYFCLTDLGHQFSINKVKPVTYKQDFELYYDADNYNLKCLKNDFSQIASEKCNSEVLATSIDFEKIKELAEVQAQEIHFPQKDFILQEATQKSIKQLQSKIWVCFIQSLQEDEEVRAVVYIDESIKFSNELSEVINQNTVLKDTLFEQALTNQNLEFLKAIEEKSTEQVQVEKELVLQQQEVESAILSKEPEKIQNIFSKKRLFDSLEFEAELQRIFSICDDEIWLVSPWIRDNAFNFRGPMIEDFLQRGGKVFLAFSEDEGVKKGDTPMADEHSEKQIINFEETYNENFFFTQLPPFHIKNVLSKFKNNSFLGYTGSFNVLSFYVDATFRQVRREEMNRFDWNDEAVAKYNSYKVAFAKKYIKKAISEIDNKLNSIESISNSDLSTLKSFIPPRLKYFYNSEDSEIKELISQYEDKKENAISKIRTIISENELGRLKTLLTDIGNVTIIQKNEFQTIVNKIKSNSDSFYLEEDIKEIQGLIDDLKPISVFEKKEKSFKNNPNKKIVNKPYKKEELPHNSIKPLILKKKNK